MIFPPEIIPVTLAVFAAAALSALVLLQRAQFGTALSDMRKSLDQTQAQQHFLEALIASGSECVAVFDAATLAPRCYGGAGELLKLCMNGPHAARFAGHLDKLLRDGIAFDFALQVDGRHIRVRGRPLGRRGVLFLREQRPRADAQDFRGLLERMPLAIAVFDAQQNLTHFNRAFAQCWRFTGHWLESRPSAADIFDTLRETGRLPAQRDYPAWKSKQLSVFGANLPLHDLWPVSGGGALRVTAESYPPGGAIFLFEDIGEYLALKTETQAQKLAQRALLDTIEDGLAVFGPDGRLKTHNHAFAKLFRLNANDLAEAPHHSKLAALASGRGGGAIAEAIASDAPQSIADAVLRVGERIVSLSFARLPDGTTLATFNDITDIERFLQENELLDRAASL